MDYRRFRCRALGGVADHGPRSSVPEPGSATFCTEDLQTSAHHLCHLPDVVLHRGVRPSRCSLPNSASGRGESGAHHTRPFRSKYLSWNKWDENIYEKSNGLTRAHATEA